MEEEQYHDRLENFFRQSYREEASAGETAGWDVPSPQLWTDIETHLPAPPAPVQRNYWYPLLGLVLILGLGLTAGYFYQRQQHLQAQVGEKQREIAQLQERIGQLEQTQIMAEEVPNEPTVQAGLSNTQAIVRTSEKKTTALTSPTASIPQRSKDVVVKLPSSATLQQSAVSAIHESVQRETSVPMIALPVNASLVDPMPELPHLAYRTSFAALQSTIFRPQRPVELMAVRAQKSTHAGVFAGVYVAPNFADSKLRISSSQGGGQPAFRQMEQTRVTAEYGVKLGYQLSKRWSIYTGISKRSAALRSQQVFRIDYNPELEIPGANGTVESNYDLRVASSYGRSTVDVNLQRPSDQPVPSNQVLLLRLRSKQELSFLSVPLVLSHHLHWGRVVFNFQVGLGMNRVQGWKGNTQVQSLARGIRVRNVAMRRSMEEINTTTFDYILGLGASFRLTPQWSLALEPTFRANLSPLVKNEVFSSSSQAVGVQLGVYRRF